MQTNRSRTPDPRGKHKKGWSGQGTGCQGSCLGKVTNNGRGTFADNSNKAHGDIPGDLEAGDLGVVERVEVVRVVELLVSSDHPAVTIAPDPGRH